MIATYILFLTPVLLFVLAFLYETYMSFARLYSKKIRTAYLKSTWEFTHTLLVFAVVMLIMLCTQALDKLADRLFLSTFLAAVALGLRAALYIYIFYVQKKPTRSLLDWIFAWSHVVAALLLVVTVLKAVWFLHSENPTINTQFLPYFLPGLALVLAATCIPIISIYRTKD